MEYSLKYEPVSLNYLDRAAELWSSNKVIKYTNIKQPLSYRESKERLLKLIDMQYNINTIFIILADMEFCGIAGCPVINKDKLEFGFFYQILENYWNKNIGFKSAEWIISYMINHYKKLTIYADVIEDNIASVKILDKLGFSLTQKHIQEFERNEKLFNILDYKLEI